MNFFRNAIVFMVTCASMSELRADELNPELQKYAIARVAEISEIPADRREYLQKLADYISARQSAGQTARLTFVCTHNSRRSQFAQLWATAAATYYGLDRLESFSGGTESTAFNPRAIAALTQAGFKIAAAPESESNPHYEVHFLKVGQPVECFSKVYDSPPNPREDFCAVMTCSEADQACPTVRGCDLRLAIPYTDPKIADSTPRESATYAERCAQIAREMFFVMSQVDSKSSK